MKNRQTNIQHEVQLVNYFNGKDAQWFVTYAASLLTSTVGGLSVAAITRNNHPSIALAAATVAVMGILDPYIASYFGKPSPVMHAATVAHGIRNAVNYAFFGSKQTAPNSPPPKPRPLSI